MMPPFFEAKAGDQGGRTNQKLGKEHVESGGSFRGIRGLEYIRIY